MLNDSKRRKDSNLPTVPNVAPAALLTAEVLVNSTHLYYKTEQQVMSTAAEIS